MISGRANWQAEVLAKEGFYSSFVASAAAMGRKKTVKQLQKSHGTG